MPLSCVCRRRNQGYWRCDGICSAHVVRSVRCLYWRWISCRTAHIVLPATSIMTVITAITLNWYFSRPAVSVNSTAASSACSAPVVLRTSRCNCGSRRVVAGPSRLTCRLAAIVFERWNQARNTSSIGTRGPCQLWCVMKARSVTGQGSRGAQSALRTTPQGSCVSSSRNTSGGAMP